MNTATSRDAGVLQRVLDGLRALPVDATDHGGTAVADARAYCAYFNCCKHCQHIDGDLEYPNGHLESCEKGCNDAEVTR